MGLDHRLNNAAYKILHRRRSVFDESGLNQAIYLIYDVRIQPKGNKSFLTSLTVNAARSADSESTESHSVLK